MPESLGKEPSVKEHENAIGLTSTIDSDSIGRLSREEYEALEKKLTRSLDIRLLPMIVLMYIMNYLDRNNIAAARLAGLEDDLHLSSEQFQTSVSILFVGYTLMQIPSNLFLDKIGRPSLYLPAVMVIWGIISGATAATQSYGGLVACRFVLGFIEAAYFPGCLFYLSSWYTRKELGFRVALLYSGALLSGAFSGLITAGITDNMDGTRGLRAWRWLFIIEGSITVCIAMVAFLILPDFPKTSRWLSPQQRELAMWRLEAEAGKDWQGGQKENLFHGLKLVFVDIKTYMLMVLLFGITSSGSVTNFFPTVVKTLGFSNTNTLLLTVPPYALAVVATFVHSRHADATGERYLHIVIPCTIAVVAFILAACTTTLAPRYVSMLLMLPSIYCAYVVSLAWISNTLPRPPAKRAGALALINSVSNASSIWTAFYYPQSAGPRYIAAMGLNCGTIVLSMLAATVLRWHLGRLNKKLERGEPVMDVAPQGRGAGEEEGPAQGIDRSFRYLL